MKKGVNDCMNDAKEGNTMKIQTRRTNGRNIVKKSTKILITEKCSICSIIKRVTREITRIQTEYIFHFNY